MVILFKIYLGIIFAVTALFRRGQQTRNEEKTANFVPNEANATFNVTKKYCFSTFSLELEQIKDKRGYGRISHILPSPEVGQDFQMVTVT